MTAEIAINCNDSLIKYMGFFTRRMTEIAVFEKRSKFKAMQVKMRWYGTYSILKTIHTKDDNGTDHYFLSPSFNHM